MDAVLPEYIDADRDKINEGVRAALEQLDGSPASAVALLTGIAADQLDQYGGVPKTT